MAKHHILIPGIGRKAPGAPREFLGWGHLSELYGIPLSQCSLLLEDEKGRIEGKVKQGLLPLRAREDGIYHLPGAPLPPTSSQK